MKPIVRQGLVVPGVRRAVTLVVWLAAGTGWALLVLALGAAAIIGFHLHYLQQFTDWAARLARRPGPCRARRVGAGVRGHVQARADAHRVPARPEAHDRALPAGGRGDSRWHRRARPEATESNGRIRARSAQLGLDLDHDVGQPIVNLVRQPEFLRYLDAGDYGDAIVVASGRDARTTLALQLVPFSLDKKMLMSRDVTQLEAVARMRRDFIANVSHELKTPLTVISGFIETMQDMELDERQRGRFLQLMQEQASNMQRLVVDLITLSALESEQNPLVDERFAIVPLMLELSAEAKALSKGQHEIDARHRRRGDGAGQPRGARRVRSEISSATRSATRRPRAASRWHGASTPTGSGVFSVRDSGIGIAAEHLPRLTERFYRVDRSRSRATGGTGLGLAIVKHVLLRHQAELDIESEIGQRQHVLRAPAGKRVERAPRNGRRPPRDSTRRRRSPVAKRRAKQAS